MEHRVRAAALIVDDSRLLLVRLRQPRTGEEWWVPPGGGLKDDESIFEAAIREVWEETGLNVELGKIVYLRQFVETDRPRHHFEVFILATGFSGELTRTNLVGKDDEHDILEVRFVSREEMQALVVYPPVLKTDFWHHLELGFPDLNYLGVDHGTM